MVSGLERQTVLLTEHAARRLDDLANLRFRLFQPGRTPKDLDLRIELLLPREHLDPGVEDALRHTSADQETGRGEVGGLGRRIQGNHGHQGGQEDGEDDPLPAKDNRREISAVVLDVIMPKRNGHEVYRRLSLAFRYM